ncbi:MAG: beta strand repeat-containing protein, partial [Gammaproteobacteria bacterium]
VLTPPSVSSPNGGYGSLPTASDPAEITSSQVVYAASGDFTLTMIERAIAEPSSPPNPLSSNDLDLFEFTVERGFAGRQGPGDQMASEAVLIEHTAKTVAGQVVVKAAAEGSVLLRRNDPRTDLGTNLGCDPQRATCTINRNPAHDTYLYDPQTRSYQFLCSAGPATETCGTIVGRGTATNGFVYEAFLAVDTTRTPDYGCPANDPDCAPGIRIRSSIYALDPRDRDLSYGFSMHRSLDVDAAPNEYRGGLVLTRDASGRPVDEMLAASARGSNVVIDPRDARSRDFDFGTGGGIRPLALELLSAGDLRLGGRDICVTFDGSCFQQGVTYRSSDPYAAARVNLRLQAGSGNRPTVYAERLLRLEEAYLAGADLAVTSYQTTHQGGQQPLRQLVLRNALIDPNAGPLNGGYSDDPARIVVGTSADATNDFTLGSIFGGNGTEVDVDVRGMLTIIDTFSTGAGAPPPGDVSAGNISLKGRGISVGALNLTGLVDDQRDHTLTLLSRAIDPAKFSFGVISAYAPNSTVSITSAATLGFDPRDKFNTSALPDNLRLVSTGGKLCVGSTDGGDCIVSDLDFAGFVDLQGQLGVEAGAVKAGREARLRAAAGSVVAGDVEGKVVDIQAGAKLGPAAGADPWSEGEGSFTASVGKVTALDGTVLVLGRDGVEAGDVSQARVAAPTPQVAEVELRSRSGSIVAGTVESLGADPGVGGRLKVETAQGALISLAAVTAGDVDVRAGAGRVRIGVEGAGFTAGAVTARSGRVSLEGRDGVEAGTLTATTQVDVSAGRGRVAVGAASAGGPAVAAGSPCDGLTVCIGAGFDGTDGSGRTVTLGAVTATVGSVLMSGRDGVTTGGAVLASAGSVEIRSSAGTVDTTAGTVTAGSPATPGSPGAAFDAKLSGISLNLGDVTARRDIDLAANGATGSLATGVLTATRALKVTSVSGFGIAAAKIGGAPQSVLLSSSDGGVCLGTLVSGVCTGQSLTKDTDLTLQGRTGVTSGALAVRSALVDSSQGALALGDVTVSDGKLALYGRTGVTAGKLTQSRSGTPPTAPDIDLRSDAGAITVGDVSGKGLMYGRAAEGLTTGAIAGVKDIDLRAGKALTTGAVGATGSVTLRSTAGAVTSATIDAGGLVDAQASGGALAVGAVTARGGTVLLRGRDGVTAGAVTQTRTGSALQIPDVQFTADAGSVTVGAVTSSGSVRGDATTDIVTGAVTAVRDVRLVAGGGVTAGDIVTSGGGVRLQAGSGSLTAGDITAAAALQGGSTDPCDGLSVCVRAGDGASSGAQTVRVGDVVATAGGVSLRGRSGVTLDTARVDKGDLTLESGAGGVTAGALVVGDATATAPAPYSLKIEARDAITLGTASAPAAARATGAIAMSSATGAITAGALTAGRYIDIEAAGGSVRLGALNAGGVVVLATTDVCNGASVCVTAGGDPQAGAQTVTIDAIDAKTGNVSIAAPTVTLGASTARDGDLLVTAGPGGVTATGDLAAGGSGATAADRDVRISGDKLVLRGVRASGEITLTASGTQPSSGTIQTGLLEARRDLKLASVADLGIAAADIGGAPESIDLSSSSGRVCIGALVNGVCTGQALSKNSTTVTLTGRTGVVTGDLGAARLQVRASEGATVSGTVTSADGVDIAGRDGVTTAGVTARKAVSLVASSGTVDAGAVTVRDGTVLLQGRTGVKAGAITQARAGGALQVPDIDLIADGGSVAVGAVSGTGGLRGRALDTLAIGAVSGVDAVQLTAGKALTASGAIASRGGVELRSDTAGVGVQDVTAGGAVTVTARDAVTAGDVVGATTTAGDVTLTSTDGALTVKSVTAGTSTVASNVELRAKGRVGVDASASTPGGVTASGGVRLESQAADVRVGDVTARNGTLQLSGQQGASAGAPA